MDLTLVLEEPASSAGRELLAKALLEYGTQLHGEPGFTSVGCFLRDASGQIQAGLSGRFRWKWLYVEMLWVAEPLRGRGHGSTLLRTAEDFARSRGGVAVHLETGGASALPFYGGHGYEVVASMDGYPPGTKTHFLRKWLKTPPG